MSISDQQKAKGELSVWYIIGSVVFFWPVITHVGNVCSRTMLKASAADGSPAVALLHKGLHVPEEKVGESVGISPSSSYSLRSSLNLTDPDEC